MAVVGLLAHPDRPAATKLAEETARWLHERGHQSRRLRSDDPAGPIVCGDQDPSELSVAVSLGGDGTMLRTVDLVSPYGVPVIGVNFGQLGYLTTVEPDGLLDALARFVAGDFDVESRMTLDVTLAESDGTVVFQRSVLNDVVLQRPGGGHTVRVGLSVSGTRFLTYAADGLIVATPTGSTAYNLSARGPIVSPRARVVIVTPVAAHMLFDRSLVLGPDEPVALTPSDTRSADVVIDGSWAAALDPGRTLTCRAGRHDALLVAGIGAPDFHDVLKRKFDLGDR